MFARVVHKINSKQSTIFIQAEGDVNVYENVAIGAGRFELIKTSIKR